MEIHHYKSNNDNQGRKAERTRTNTEITTSIHTNNTQYTEQTKLFQHTIKHNIKLQFKFNEFCIYLENLTWMEYRGK